MRRLLAVSSLCLLFVPAALTLHAREAAACSCIPSPGPVEAAQSVDVVFQAKLAAIGDAPKGSNYDIPSKVFTFDVVRTFKGQLDGRVTVISADNSAACGRAFGAVGDEWLVYARRDETGQLHDNLCSRSMPFGDAGDDVAELEANADRLDEPPPQPELPEEPGPAEPEPEPIPPQDTNTSGEEPEPTAKPGRCTVTEDTPAGGLAGFLTLALGVVALRRRRST